MPELRRFWGYVLKTEKGHTLDNHIFRDFPDAQVWMSQPFVRGTGYKVVCATYRKRSCCGKPFSFRFGSSIIEFQ